MINVQTLSIDHRYVGVNIIKYLQAEHMYPYATAQKIIRTGQLRVNSKRVAFSYNLKLADQVRLPLGLLQALGGRKPASVPSNRAARPGVSPLSEMKVTQASNSHLTKKTHVELAQAIAYLANNIIYEDASLIAFNKNNRLASQKGKNISVSISEALLFLPKILSTSKRATLHKSVCRSNCDSGMFTVEHLQQLLRSLFATPLLAPGNVAELKKNSYKLLHRLDKETSGVLLAAKNPSAAKNLFMQFSDRSIEKHYRCLCFLPAGVKVKRQSLIKLPLYKSRSLSNKALVFDISIATSGKDKDEVPEGLKDARTFYKILKLLPAYATVQPKTNPDEVEHTSLKNTLTKSAEKCLVGHFAYVCVRPETGRYHQIRAHLSYIGMPIVGDYRYGYKDLSKPISHHCCEYKNDLQSLNKDLDTRGYNKGCKQTQGISLDRAREILSVGDSGILLHARLIEWSLSSTNREVSSRKRLKASLPWIEQLISLLASSKKPT